MEVFDGKLCVFGGKYGGTGVNLTDFLLDYRCVDVTKDIDQANPDWKLQSSASMFAMPPLAQHSSVYDRVNHIIVPYGGQAPNTFTQANHLSVFCTLYQAWGASNAVDADIRRYLHTSVLQRRSGDMIIFGGTRDETTGHGDGSRYNKVNRMILDSTRHKSNNLAVNRRNANNITIGNVIVDNGDPTPDLLKGLTQHSSVLLNDTFMVILGGNVYLDDAAVMRPFEYVHLYDVDKMTWSRRNCTGDIPDARSVAAVSQHGHYIYLQGGVNVTTWSLFYDDLYQLNTLTWSWRKMPTENAPVPRYAHQMQTLGHYLIITHGYATFGNGDVGGDKDIYFYDLRKEAFVDKYSPDGISRFDLDTEWIVRRTGAANAIASLCYILTLLVSLIAGYYLIGELRELFSNRARPRPRRMSNRDGIRSLVESYTETLRPSSYFTDKFGRSSGDRRGSQDTEGVAGMAMFAGRKSIGSAKGLRTADGRVTDGSNGRSHTLSEGTSTVIESIPSQAQQQQQQSAIQQANMRRARILDEGPESSTYVSRKLTISTSVPTYRAHRINQRPTVRFSEYSDENDVVSHRTPSIRPADLEEPIELSAMHPDSDHESSDDDQVSLRVVNADDSNRQR
ncbi:hypothetical protein H4R20_002284 [Coemansia guatemalensis]|uniref:Galactose oxidase n=1 Tax=Coemansia guatemalensis TaxID=2761395 RepID=A0A9W8LUU2_9FUNG|nr:hypothetical protein H4R20_002284 [Coemansia guatemalensis]